jgi:hypothetical protein
MEGELRDACAWRGNFDIKHMQGENTVFPHICWGLLTKEPSYHIAPRTYFKDKFSFWKTDQKENKWRCHFRGEKGEQ